jgi:hypothetical protein
VISKGKSPDEDKILLTSSSFFLFPVTKVIFGFELDTVMFLILRQSGSSLAVGYEDWAPRFRTVMDATPHALVDASA